LVQNSEAPTGGTTSRTGNSRAIGGGYPGSSEAPTGGTTNRTGNSRAIGGGVPGRQTPNPSTAREERFSRGDRVFFTGNSNANRDRGVEAIQRGDYFKAAEFFKKATEANRNDPEVLIYYNNARARQNQNPITLAVVVPVDNGLTSAQEMLRGVAQAQNGFNNSGGLNGRLLEIAIANDDNKPDKSAQVAEELVKDPSIIGVIGHNSSDASKAGLAVYEKAGLPMISPTSTSTSLSSKVFFRTLPSDAAAGQKLAGYAYNKLVVDDAVIFYNPKSAYSKSLKEVFEKNFKSLGGKVVRSIDLSDPNFDATMELTRIALKKEAQSALLFPDTQFTSVALEIARANSQLQGGEKLKLLGGDALYKPTTLNAGASVENLILAVPWFAKSAESQDFSNVAEKQWGGLVNWRTAMSFDATQAFIDAFSSNSSRSEVLKQLQSTNISSQKTSGSPLQFTSEGERRSEPILVKAARGGSVAPRNSEFGFEIINE
jgi:branched-chain amino acid transport system substrate-binding protein